MKTILLIALVSSCGRETACDRFIAAIEEEPACRVSDSNPRPLRKESCFRHSSNVGLLFKKEQDEQTTKEKLECRQQIKMHFGEW